MKLNDIIIGTLLSSAIKCHGFLNSNGHKQQQQQQQPPLQNDNYLIFSKHTKKYYDYHQENPRYVSTRLFADIVQDNTEWLEETSSASLIWDEIVDEYQWYTEFQYVISLLERIHDKQEKDDLGTIEANEYTKIFKEICKIRSTKSSPDLADKVLRHMIKLSEETNNDSFLPTAEIIDMVISIWSHSFQNSNNNNINAGQRCYEYLDLLWSIYYNSSQQEKGEDSSSKFLPTKSMYISTINAFSKMRRREGAEFAEQVLKDMIMLEEQYPELSPDTACMNGVLNAWSKSGVRRGAATRCEQILDKMINDYKAGRTQLQPNTASFNIVMDMLAKSDEGDAENRAEAWLQKMEDVSTVDESLSICCKPNKMSFNIVLNCWAQSKSRNSAKRATSILKHMEQRYNTNNSDFHPDAASYSTVINAWSRSRESNTVKRAEEVLKWAEEAQEHHNQPVELNVLTYNSMINCYAKSNHPEAADRALDILDMLKAQCFDEGERRYHPDVVTYTSVIDALAKQATYTASKKAETLLNELETAFEATQDIRFRPNIRTYTSTVNAIGRSRKGPERAEAILKRILEHEIGKNTLKADVVFFNALINAYGWSTCKGKAAKCYEILNMMLDLNESGQNEEAKPDIVTCNSVLNACAFEKGSSEADRRLIMDIVVKTIETFQSTAPLYGSPDHVTYAQVLRAISKHMEMDETRRKLAETTFYQCCESGQVSAMVLSSLRYALPWERFASLLGPALLSGKKTKLAFDPNKLPELWVRSTLPTFTRRGSKKSRPSRKRPNGYCVTKQLLRNRKD